MFALRVLEETTEIFKAFASIGLASLDDHPIWERKNYAKQVSNRFLNLEMHCCIHKVNHFHLQALEIIVKDITIPPSLARKMEKNGFDLTLRDAVLQSLDELNNETQENVDSSRSGSISPK